MGNPNGDPDENRPRRLPDGTFYVTDVRLKRFVRDWLKTQGEAILVDRPEDSATNLAGRLKRFLNIENTPAHLTERVKSYLQTVKDSESKNTKQEDAPSSDPGSELVKLILDAFIDARLFGSSLAFKNWERPSPKPKTLTGAVQINMGEALNRAEEVDIAGTSIFASAEEKTQGTFTTFYGLRYALIAFNGVANEHSARLSRLTDADYDQFLTALWKSVGSSRPRQPGAKPAKLRDCWLMLPISRAANFTMGDSWNMSQSRPRMGNPRTNFLHPEISPWIFPHWWSD